jgi:hypothetical protein
MKTQTYTVLRSTLLPCGDMVWVQLKAKKRGNEQIDGDLSIYVTPDKAPAVGTEVIVEVKWEIKS